MNIPVVKAKLILTVCIVLSLFKGIALADVLYYNDSYDAIYRVTFTEEVTFIGDWDEPYVLFHTVDLGPGEVLHVTDWYSGTEAHFYWYYDEEWIYGGGSGGGGGGGGGGGLDIDDPFADVDENGIGTIEPFGFEPINGSNSVPSYFEWAGIAVGVFVEPVDWFFTLVEIYRDPWNPWSYAGFIPGVPAAAGKLVKKAANVVSSTVLRNVHGGIKILAGDKNKGMEHIIRGHAPTSPAPNKSKFASGMGQTQIGDVIDDALGRAGPPLDQGWANVYEVSLPYSIGVTQSGAVTNKIRIVVDKSNNSVQNAYPIP